MDRIAKTLALAIGWVGLVLLYLLVLALSPMPTLRDMPIPAPTQDALDVLRDAQRRDVLTSEYLEIVLRRCVDPSEVLTAMRDEGMRVHHVGMSEEP